METTWKEWIEEENEEGDEVKRGEETEGTRPTKRVEQDLEDSVRKTENEEDVVILKPRKDTSFKEKSFVSSADYCTKSVTGVT